MAPFRKNNGKKNAPESNNHANVATTTTTTTTPKNNQDQDYNARRSSRVATSRYVADNDTWVEALAVCEMPNKKGEKKSTKSGNTSGGSGGGGGGLLSKFKKSGNNDATTSSNQNSTNTNHNNNQGGDGMDPYGEINLTCSTEAEIASASQRLALRPYFQSQNTGQRVWDEPPSGASNIIYASGEARKMAKAQLEEMRATYAQAALVRRREREQERLVLEASAREATAGGSKNGGGGKVSSVIGRGLSKTKLFRSASTSAVVAKGGSGAGAAVNGLSDSRRSSQNSNSHLAVNGGIPASILHESIALAAANDSNHSSNNDSTINDRDASSYEKDLQMAMLMSMGIGGGSVTGLGDGLNNTSNTRKTYSSRGKSKSAPTSRRNSHQKASNTSSSSKSQQAQDEHSLLTREEQEQLAMATALSLSEEEARRNSKKLAKQQYQQRSRSHSNSSRGEEHRSRSSSLRRSGSKTSYNNELIDANSKQMKPRSSRNTSDNSSKPPLPMAKSSRAKNAPSSTHEHQTLQYKQNEMQQLQSDVLPTLASTDESSFDDRGGGGKVPAIEADNSFGDFLGVKDTITSTGAESGGDGFGGKGSEWELEWIHEEKKVSGENGGSRKSRNQHEKFAEARQY